MKNVLLLALLALSSSLSAQSKNEPSGCAAAFLNDKMIVDHYSPEGKCKLTKSSKGVLTAGTVNLNEKGVEITCKFEFALAIRDKETGSLTLYSKDTYTKIDIQKVMEKCEVGDKIVMITTDGKYELLHNEILVE